MKSIVPAILISSILVSMGCSNISPPSQERIEITHPPILNEQLHEPIELNTEPIDSPEFPDTKPKPPYLEFFNPK
jgi:hypothetical protein